MARFALALFTVGALVAPSPSDGQLVGGVFGSRARDTFAGTNGVGAEAGVSLPMLPFDVFVDGMLFFPSCAECDFKGWSLGVRFRILPLPVVRPYLTGRGARRAFAASPARSAIERPECSPPA